MSDSEYFSDEYQPVSQTGQDNIENQCETTNIPEIESEIYGISKPQRVIIKARLIDGEN